MLPGRVGLLLLVLLLYGTAAQGLGSREYSLVVPELLGEHSQIDRPQVVEVDFGREFRQIEAVWIELEGRALPGRGEATTRDGEGTGRELPMHLVPGLSLADAFAPARFDLRDPVARLEPLEGSFHFEADFAAPRQRPLALEPTTWDFLLDGRAALRITWRSSGCGGTGGCRFHEHAKARVTRASLVVRGVPR